MCGMPVGWMPEKTTDSSVNVLRSTPPVALRLRGGAGGCDGFDSKGSNWRRETVYDKDRVRCECGCLKSRDAMPVAWGRQDDAITDIFMMLEMTRDTAEAEFARQKLC